MIPYFEKQMRVIAEALETLNEGEFQRLVREATEAIEGGHVGEILRGING